MTTINPNPFDYLFADRGTSTAIRAGHTLRAIWQRGKDRVRSIAAKRRLRDEYDTMMTMPDHMLRDIGLDIAHTRGDGFQTFANTRIGML